MEREKKMTAKNTPPKTLHELLVKDFGKRGLASSAKILLADMHHQQCTFENDFWELLRDRNDKRFQEYNKATGLGRSAMCLVDSAYKRRAILSAALEAYIEKLKEKRNAESKE